MRSRGNSYEFLRTHTSSYEFLRSKPTPSHTEKPHEAKPRLKTMLSPAKPQKPQPSPGALGGTGRPPGGLHVTVDWAPPRGAPIGIPVGWARVGVGSHLGKSVEKP